MNNNNTCIQNCLPAQSLNINTAIDDFSNISIYDQNENKYDNECLEWSYSMDNVIWSCWMTYTEAANILFEQPSDYFIRAKVNGTIGKVEINNDITTEYSTSLVKCFDFTKLAGINPNQYNPYANTEYAMGLYQSLTDMVSNITGIPIYYIKLSPNQNSKDVTFKEYALMGVEAIKQIKLIVNEGQMPSSRPEFSEFGFDFSTDWETEISKNIFASAFGMYAKPMEGDLIYIPMMDRMWMVNSSYEEKNDGFMWKTTTFKVMLVKYEEKGSVDLGDAQSFVDSIVKTKYDDIFGIDEGVGSGENSTDCPEHAYNELYPVFESDAIRKYVKNSEGLLQLNTKLISNPKYQQGMLVADNAYDWTKMIEGTESFIIYQKQYCGTDATISFILDTGNKYCHGVLFDISNIRIIIDMTPTNVELSINNICNISLNSNSSYFIIARWSKQMNIVELSAAEYTYPKDMPFYKVQKFNYKFDIDNMIKSISKYDIELEQCNGDVITYSFDGKITNIKVYDKYIDNISEVLQMYPTNNHLIINDTARKFVELPGTYIR